MPLTVDSSNLYVFNKYSLAGLAFKELGWLLGSRAFA